MVEHSTENAGVVSSILTLGTSSNGGKRISSAAARRKRRSERK